MDQNVLEHGAVGDGASDCTAAFRSAVSACAESGGGAVRVPAGAWVTGTVMLPSRVFLQLDPGCEVLASYDDALFPPAGRRGYRALVYADGAEDAGIIGEGTLIVRRPDAWRRENPGRARLYGVVIDRARRFTMRGVTLRDPGFFTIYSLGSEDLRFTGLRIYTRSCDNGDGIDFSGSRNVVISDCVIDAGDDAIGLKTHEPEEPRENFVITNCVLSSDWAGIRLGPETCGDMRNIAVSNCVFTDCSDGLKIQLCDSYVLEDVTASNLVMRNVERPLFFTSSSCPMSRRSAKRRPDPGRFRRITVENVTATVDEGRRGWFDPGCAVQGLPDAQIEDVTIRGLRLTVPGGGDAAWDGIADREEFVLRNDYPDVPRSPHFPSCGLFLRHARGVRVEDCVFACSAPDGRHAVRAEDAADLRLIRTEARNCAGLLLHHASPGLLTDGCRGAAEPFPPETAARREAAQALAAEQEAAVISACAVSDRIAALPDARELALFPVPGEEDGGETPPPGFCKLSFRVSPEADGAVRYAETDAEGTILAELDGEPVFRWERPAPYDGVTLAAFRLPDVPPGGHVLALRSGGFRSPVRIVEGTPRR